MRKQSKQKGVKAQPPAISRLLCCAYTLPEDEVCDYQGPDQIQHKNLKNVTQWRNPLSAASTQAQYPALAAILEALSQLNTTLGQLDVKSSQAKKQGANDKSCSSGLIKALDNQQIREVEQLANRRRSTSSSFGLRSLNQPPRNGDFMIFSQSNAVAVDDESDMDNQLPADASDQKDEQHCVDTFYTIPNLEPPAPCDASDWGSFASLGQSQLNQEGCQLAPPQCQASGQLQGQPMVPIFKRATRSSLQISSEAGQSKCMSWLGCDIFRGDQTCTKPGTEPLAAVEELPQGAGLARVQSKSTYYENSDTASDADSFYTSAENAATQDQQSGLCHIPSQSDKQAAAKLLAKSLPAAASSELQATEEATQISAGSSTYWTPAMQQQVRRQDAMLRSAYLPQVPHNLRHKQEATFQQVKELAEEAKGLLRTLQKEKAPARGGCGGLGCARVRADDHIIELGQCYEEDEQEDDGSVWEPHSQLFRWVCELGDVASARVDTVVDSVTFSNISSSPVG